MWPILLSVCIMPCLAATAMAHEYWIEPERFQLATGDEIRADLKNGQDFRGLRYPYITRNFDLFILNGPDGSEAVKGRDGDMPAFVAPAGEPGLYTLSYQGKFDRITFTDPEKLNQYITYEGLDGTLERHAERGLAPDHFEEHYARCAKALVQVGDPGSETDSLTGLKFELVAEDNPYHLTEDDTLHVRLYWEGKPATDTQIRWFRYLDRSHTGTVTTDSEGLATIPLKGGGKFLLNAVRLLEGDEEPNTDMPEWFSYWASLTFGIAGTDEALEKARQDQADP